MRCPFCGKDHDKVIDSRATEGGAAVRRRRQCIECGRRFTTYEYVEQTVKLSVIKRDGSRVPYNREKMLAGLERACYKRPVPQETLRRIVDEVEEEIFRKHDREVHAGEIGRALADKLKKEDHIAYVRFASVFKQFRDIDQLLDEVRDVIESSAAEPPEGQGKLFQE